MSDTMTVKQAFDRAVHRLVRGKWYRFKRPIKAMAVPISRRACEPTECIFVRGCYVGPYGDSHLFWGKPADDRRLIHVPKGQDWSAEELRKSYFHVSFTSILTSITAVMDSDQADH